MDDNNEVKDRLYNVEEYITKRCKGRCLDRQKSIFSLLLREVVETPVNAQGLPNILVSDICLRLKSVRLKNKLMFWKLSLIHI